MSLEIGQLIDDKYRIVRLVGEGGMGSVYEGENTRISRRVAIKVLHAAYTGNKEVMQRFEREAQAAGRIGNDHILEILDLGMLPNGDHFMVMEFLDGEPLSNRIKSRGRMQPQEVAHLCRQILTGLTAAHGTGIIHRDLKPDNIFILKQKAGKQDFVKIIDFGISKFQPLSGDAMKMTRTGAVMGTPYYMSPEQASGSQDADHRSDIYAVGVMLYEAVTGRVPFDAATFNQLMFKIVLADVPAPETFVPNLDSAFSSIIAKAMARDVSFRFQTCAEFIQALDAWLERGAAVTIPPEAGAGALLPDAPRASMASVPGLSGSQAGAKPTKATNGAWATSQVDTLPKKSAAPLIAAAVVTGLFLAGGAVLAAVELMGGADDPATPSSVTEPASSPPVVSEPPPAVEVTPIAPVLPSTASSAEAEKATDGAGTETSKGEPQASKSEPSPSVPVAKKVTPAVRPRPAAATKPPASPKKEPVKTPTTTKPKTESVPDFGY